MALRDARIQSQRAREAARSPKIAAEIHTSRVSYISSPAGSRPRIDSDILERALVDHADMRMLDDENGNEHNILAVFSATETNPARRSIGGSYVSPVRREGPGKWCAQPATESHLIARPASSHLGISPGCRPHD